MNSDVTIKNYEEKRRELVELNSNLSGVVMREKEKKLDAYLSSLKKEYLETPGAKNGYAMRVLTDKNITSSRLYAFCSRLPKGADLHVHDMSLLPARELIKLITSHREFFINADRRSFDLKISHGEPLPGYLPFYEALENGYYSEEEIIHNWTVASADKSGLGIWDYFEKLFDRQAVLSGNPSFAFDYYVYTFRYYCRLHISHVEIHLMLTDGIEDSEEYVRAIRSAYYEVKKEHPAFTVRIIGAGVKADNENIELTKKCFLNTVCVGDAVKDESDPDAPADFVIGFDLVNEEDSSLPLRAFAPMLLKAKRQFPAMKLYIHGGESLDAGNENLIDAYLLGVSRVGHGFNLYRYPDLHSRYVKSEICLEVCPISNQVLGYTKDVRNHPATEYLRSGMALSLCSDDPAYMENETLTDDFFAAVAAWDLGIADVKQFGINSILYSGLDEKSKFRSLKAYNDEWNAFVDEITEKSDGTEK